MSALKKRIVIEFDVISGHAEVTNEDKMTYFEVIGAVEYAKMMLMKDWLEAENSR